MTRAIALRLVWNNLEQKIFWTELALMLALFAAYVYFISSSVVNVVLRQEATVEIAALNSKISTLEAEYLAQKQNVDAALAVSEGFAPIAATHYITDEGGKVSKSD